jgi:hypothetical protein
MVDDQGGSQAFMQTSPGQNSTRTKHKTPTHPDFLPLPSLSLSLNLRSYILSSVWNSLAATSMPIFTCMTREGRATELKHTLDTMWLPWQQWQVQQAYLAGVASLLNCASQQLETLLIVANVGCKAALITDVAGILACTSMAVMRSGSHNAVCCSMMSFHWPAAACWHAAHTHISCMHAYVCSCVCPPTAFRVPHSPRPPNSCTPQTILPHPAAQASHQRHAACGSQQL